jgi:hypothetical protein
MARDFSGNRLAPLDGERVDKPNAPPSPVVTVCPSCGLASLDSPHASSEQCVRALEAEVARLSQLVQQFKAQRGGRKRKE